MFRRTFLEGTLAGIVGAVASVRLATPEEATAVLTPNAPVKIAPLSPIMSLPWPEDGLVYFKIGKNFEPAGYLTDINVSCNTYETWDTEGHARLIPGLKSTTMTFKSRK